MIAVSIFWLCAGLLIYSYVVYPLLLEVLSGRQPDQLSQSDPDEWPSVAVLLAAYNEAGVIRSKLDSVFNLDYPADKLILIVGSDGSTDETDTLVQQHPAYGTRLILVRLEGRNGKSTVLNEIAKHSGSADILLLTDANILFETEMLKNLVRHFKHPLTGLVGAFVKHPALPHQGIARQESQYISRENRIKYLEGKLWGTTMGAFGACYAIRREFFPPIPGNYLMEDFYVTMSVLSQGFAAVVEPRASCVEDLPPEMSQEFRRKVRISTGNFQNLAAWRHLLLRPGALSFTFFSHKVIRWLGPFLLLICWLSSALIAMHNQLYIILLGAQSLLFISPLLDSGLERLGLRVGPLRLIGYFYSMNLALIVGFIRYKKGVRNSAWQPTARKSSND